MIHLHHYVNGVCAGDGAVPEPCGEPQKFTPPTGKSASFPEVFIERADCEAAVAAVRARARQLTQPGEDELNALADRLEAAL